MSSGTMAGLAELSDAIVALVERVIPSTAMVSGQTRELTTGSGSAWVCDTAGHLVTNAHVVSGLVPPIHVGLRGYPHLEATVKGVDPLTDLAVLATGAGGLDPLAIRQTPPRLGEICFAFGSPLGEFPDSVSLGVVSGIRRRLPARSGRSIEDVIQTDAAINPGNSGGPLVDALARVIGVNTSIRADAEGIGFAIPAETVRDIVTELLEFGRVDRASLGITVATRRVEVEGGLKERLAVINVRAEHGAVLRVDDLLLAVGGKPVSTRGDLLRVLDRPLIGRPTELQVWREGKRLAVEVTPGRLEDRAEDGAAPRPAQHIESRRRGG